jgi:dethiobiotin synthetase
VKKIIFVTGTDTGVGKTVLTALLLAHLREQGTDALGMKPFCSGDRGDATLLHSLQEGCLTLQDVNPFYFDKPLAPAAAPKRVPFQKALDTIRALADRCDVLLVEGAGGLLAPLGDDYTARDLIGALGCETIVVGRNCLGTINHTILTVEALQKSATQAFAIVLMEARKPDLSAFGNLKMLRQRLGFEVVFSIPHLVFRVPTARAVKKNVKFMKKVLARLV